MKNFQKFTTAQERAVAFRNFCQPNACHDCGKCNAYGDGRGSLIECAFHWLDLECEEEKPETIEDIVDEMRRHTRVSAADAFYGAADWAKLCERIIAAHNRVAKAVKEETR